MTFKEEKTKWFTLSSDEKCLILKLFPLFGISVGWLHPDICFHVSNQQTSQTDLKNVWFHKPTTVGSHRKTFSEKDLLRFFLVVQLSHIKEGRCRGVALENIEEDAEKV